MSVIVPFPLCGYKISIYSDVVVALLTTWLIPSVHVGGPILRVVVKLLLFIICWLLLGRIRLMLLLNFSFSFYFLFLLTHISNPRGKGCFSWKIFLFSLPRVRLEISILGQGHGQNLTSGSRGLHMVGHDLCQDICLANGSATRECPNHFHETHIMMTRSSCKINHNTHPCGHSNIRLLWPCKHEGLGFVSPFKSNQCFKDFSFY